MDTALDRLLARRSRQRNAGTVAVGGVCAVGPVGNIVGADVESRGIVAELIVATHDFGQTGVVGMSGGCRGCGPAGWSRTAVIGRPSSVRDLFKGLVGLIHAAGRA